MEVIEEDTVERFVHLDNQVDNHFRNMDTVELAVEQQLLLELAHFNICLNKHT